jgi:hypothetical protein
MAYPIPKIIYNPGTGNVTLNFTYPPVNKPLIDEMFAVRSDTDTLSGIRQSFFTRIDTFKTLQMDNVPNADVPAWQAFFNFAMTGQQFHYHEDATLPAYKTYTLDIGGPTGSGSNNEDLTPARNVYGLIKFTLSMRYVVGADGTE